MPMIVQEDGAEPHASQHQHRVFMDAKILRLLWSGNSPDLNMIEPCWFHMKKETMKKGPPENHLITKKVWTRA